MYAKQEKDIPYEDCIVDDIKLSKCLLFSEHLLTHAAISPSDRCEQVN